MKIKKKNLTAALVGLCLAIACCTAFSSRYTSRAASDIPTTDIISAVNAEAAYSSEAGGVTVVGNGGSYSGQINGVFKGSVTLRMDFLGDEENVWVNGDSFRWTITDVSDPENSFYIEYMNTVTWAGIGYTIGHVYYKDQVRTAAHDNMSWDNRFHSGEYAMCAPQFPGGYGEHGAADLKLVWDESGVLHVEAYRHGIDISRDIAAFDGTETFVNKVSWGLPKLSFPDGYKITFESSETAPDICFQAITDGADKCDLNSETVAAPAFYTEFLNTPVWEIDEFGFKDTYVGAGITVPQATVRLQSGASQTLTEATVTDSLGSVKVTPGGVYTIRTKGLHTVTYTSDIGIESMRTISRTFYAYSGSFGISDVVTAEGASVTYAADRFGYRGITVGADMTEPAEYTGRIGGIFIDDALIEFTFPHEYLDTNQPVSSTFTFSVNDLSGSKIFDIIYTASDGYFTQTYVRYGDEIRSITNNGDLENWSYATYYMYRAPTGEQQLMAPAISMSAGDATKRKTATLGLQWRGDILEVTAVSREGNPFVIAAFDGSEKPSASQIGPDGYMRADTENPTWGLDKLYDRLKNGYTVSFAYDGRGVVPVTFKAINGIDLADRDYLATDYAFAASVNPADAQIIDGEIYLPSGLEIGEVRRAYSVAFMGAGSLYANSWGVGHKVYESGVAETYGDQVNTDEPDTYALCVYSDEEGSDYEGMDVTFTVHVEDAKTLTFDSRGGDAVAPIVWSEHTRSRIQLPEIEKLFWRFDGWYYDEECHNAAAVDGITDTMTVYAKWTDATSPAIAFANGVADYAAVLAGEVKISAADVVYGDSARPEAAVLSIKYRKTSDGAYTDIADTETGAVINLAAGESLEILYTASDGLNADVSISRTVTAYARKAPTVAIGERELSGYVGLPFTVGLATATDADGEEIAVVTTVTFNGAVIETEGTFTPDKAGTYTVTYTADDGGLIGFASYTFDIVEDEQAPVIGNLPQDLSVTVGSEVEIPAVTVTDNAYTGLTAELTVTYGTESVAVSGGSFVAQKVGAYIVHYRVIDGAGNVAEETFKVTATEASAGKSGCGCGNSVAGLSSLVMAAVFVGLATALLIKRKKCI